ncbi:uncharacterized protein LOC128128375 [Lactuca sativa]|uniref:uncharacterized protein LOC128128375 n=1 Tax=Lactuca sativa TaxID=4236 RepID=UPI0022AFB2F0|nr:uncharacterized protein LOC128128375 [Lactuca sativa]
MEEVSLVEVTSSTGISFVPLELGVSKLVGLFNGSAAYLPLAFHDVHSDKPTVSSALSIGADQKNSSQPSTLSSFTMAGNVGWIEEDPEEDPEEEPEEEKEEVDEEKEEEEDHEMDMDEDEGEEEPEEEVFNPPYIARVPANRWGHSGPEPR